MLDTTKLVDILSGKRRGLVATVARGGLRCLTPLYAFGVWVRNRGFDKGKNVHRVNVPVISVGNLTTGGTGKTPMILKLASILRMKDRRVVLLSRGYRSQDDGKNDEAKELEKRLPGIIHIQNPDRVEGAKRAIQEHKAEIILLDDGFQHRRLGRDLDIVLIDATNPFGYGALLPRGLLREPISSLARADVVVVTRSDQVSEDRKSEIRQQVQKANPDLPIIEAETRPLNWIGLDGRQLPLSAPAAPQKVVAFCGIGNPDAFQRRLEKMGLAVRHLIAFPDHHHYTTSDLKRIKAAVGRYQPDSVVCTQKDLVKLGQQAADLNPIALTIELAIREEDRLMDLIESVISSASPR